MAQAPRDGNRIPTLLGVSNADGTTPVTVYADPTTHRLLVDLPVSDGTVTSVSVVSANGFAGTVATPTTTPAITLTTTVNSPVLAGNGTAISAATTTGSGSTVVLSNTPTLVTPVLGVATATSINKVAITAPATSATLTLADGSSLVTSGANSITLTSTGATNVTLPTTGTLVTLAGAEALTNKTIGNTNTITVKDTLFTIQDDGDATKLIAFQASGITAGNTRTITMPDASGTATLLGNASTGSGSVVLATSPTLVTPVLGAATATSINGLTITSSTGTLTITNGKTVSVSNTMTFAAGADGQTWTFPASSDTVVTLAATQELDNKTLDSSVGKGTWTASGTWTLPAITLGGDVTFSENVALVYDAALSADGKYCGMVRAGTAGAALAFGDLVYLAAADSRWELTDADAASTAGDVLIGMCVLAAAGDGSATTILFQGFIRADAKFPALTIGAPAYVSTTAGEIQVAKPSGTDDVVRRVGFAWTADELYFNPSNDYITIV